MSPDRRTRTTRGRKLPNWSTRTFLAALLGGVRPDNRLLVDLKSQPLQLITHVFSKSSRSHQRFLGPLFPKTLSEISIQKKSPPATDLLSEAAWQAAALIANAASLNLWLDHKRAFERALLTGNNDAARHAVDESTRQLGHSLWEFDARILLAQRTAGLEENRRVLNALVSAASELGKLHLPLMSHRAEAELSTEEYEALIEAMLAPDPEASATAQALRSWLRFRLLPYHRDLEEVTSQVLNHEEWHALVDRLLMLWWVIEQELLVTYPAVPEKWAGLIRALADAIHCPRIRFFHELTSSRSLGSQTYSSQVFDDIDAFTRGHYKDSFEIAQGLVNSYPEFLEGYELAARSAIHLGESHSLALPAGSFAQEIADAMASVLRRDGRAQNSLAVLRRLGYQLDFFWIGGQIRAFTESQSRDKMPLRLSPAVAVASTVATPRVYASLSRDSSVLSQLSRLDERYPGNAAIDLFRSDQRALHGETQTCYPVDIPSARSQRHQAFVHERLGCPRAALAIYQSLEGADSLSASELNDISAGIYRCHIALGEISLATRSIVTRIISSPLSVAAETLVELLAQYPERGDHQVSSDIAWPILFGIAQDLHYIPRNPALLHDILEDFLNARGFRRPSELLVESGRFPRSELTVLLKRVCVPTILEESVWYDSQHELEQERIRICDWLSETDQGERAVYQAEIAELIRAATIRDLTQKAERARIYVDTAAILEHLPQAVNDRTARCVSFIGLQDERLRHTTEIADIFRRTLEDVRVVVIDEAFRLFTSVFRDIRAEFLASNQFGLDANLSQRIRHGTLAGAIRAPFEQNFLVTQKGLDGQYLRNHFWIEKLPRATEEEREGVSRTLSSLSQGVDTTISEVRNEWIQIRSPSHESGLFDFEYDSLELTSLYKQVSAYPEPTAFLGGIFDSLWDRTENCLKRARSAVQEELRRRLFAELTAAERQIEATIGHERSTNIRAAISTCRTQTGVALDAVAEWLRIDEQQQAPDCRFETIVASIQGVVQRCNRNHEIHSEVQGGDTLIPGRYFRAVWDVLFILLDNAIKHSNAATVEVRVRVESGETILEVESPLSHDASPRLLNEAVAAINALNSTEQDLSLSRKEGGSGYAKIHKILRFDMGMKQHQVRVSTSNTAFTATITGELLEV